MPQPLTLDQWLRGARQAGLARLDAQLLLAQVLQRPRAWLLAHGDEALLGDQQQALDRLAAARLQGQPLAYLTGRREFYGLMLQITPAVLDPRPDSETLVDWALDCLRGPLAAHARPRVLDLGTGSGAIALALAAHHAAAEVTAVERDAAAWAVAQANARRLELPLRVLHGDWFEPVDLERFELIVSNPPYLAEDDPHLPALGAEPRQALVAGPSGLEDLARLARGAARRLSPGGWLLLEHGALQAEAVSRLLREAGFKAVAHRQDLAGHLRCTGACMDISAPG
ncbi:MAG: peptide chain release factor N(5)-glutamine methyltransferase [Rubrivivax sp.]|nr:peptide chain release factor N(5)-glutamine methyltransferase [Rubrivivax sp.]